MNIISNDCVAGYLYRDYFKTDFLNPFIWCSIDLENFLEIIKHYNEIDFRNIKCDLILNESGICKKESLTPRIIIDDKVEVNYFHYIYDKEYKELKKVGPYTIYKNIIEYTIDSYNKRLTRMIEEPVFIWDVTKCQWYNKNDKQVFETFNELNSEYKIIIYQPNVKNCNINNISLLNKVNTSFEVNISAEHIYKNIFIKNK